MQFPLDFEIWSHPIYAEGINYVYRRTGKGLISVYTHANSDVYEVYDMEYMEDVEIMSFAELNEYLSKEAIRPLLQFQSHHFN